MKNQLFEDLIESIKELPTEILEEMRMNMNEEQMRKDFEDWFKKSGWNVMGVDDFCTIEGFYCDAFVAGCYDAWKASRESLVVELPHEVWTDYNDNGQYDYGYRMCIFDVKEAIESQGIKWK